MAGQIHGFLVQRIGHRSVNLVIHGQPDDFFHILEGRVSGHRGDLPPLELVHINHTHVADVDGTVLKQRLTHIPDGMYFELAGEAGYLQRLLHHRDIAHNQRFAALIDRRIR